MQTRPTTIIRPSHAPSKSLPRRRHPAARPGFEALERRELLSVSPPDAIDLAFARDAQGRPAIQYDPAGGFQDAHGHPAYFEVNVLIKDLEGRKTNNVERIKVNLYWATGKDPGDILAPAGTATRQIDHAHYAAGDVVTLDVNRLASPQPAGATYLYAEIVASDIVRGSAIEANTGDNSDAVPLSGDDDHPSPAQAITNATDTAATSGVGQAVDLLNDAAQPVVDALGTAATSGVGQAVDLLNDAAQPVVDALGDAATSGVGQAVDMLNDAAQPVVDALGDAATSGVDEAVDLLNQGAAASAPYIVPPLAGAAIVSSSFLLGSVYAAGLSGLGSGAAALGLTSDGAALADYLLTGSGSYVTGSGFASLIDPSNTHHFEATGLAGLLFGGFNPNGVAAPIFVLASPATIVGSGLAGMFENYLIDYLTPSMSSVQDGLGIDPHANYEALVDVLSGSAFAPKPPSQDAFLLDAPFSWQPSDS